MNVKLPPHFIKCGGFSAADLPLVAHVVAKLWHAQRLILLGVEKNFATFFVTPVEWVYNMRRSDEGMSTGCECVRGKICPELGCAV